MLTLCFFFLGKAVTLEKKVIVAHPMQNFVPVIPLQTGYGTQKFLFHSMIIMINYKRTSCILIFFSFRDKYKGVFNHATIRLLNVFINKTENYISFFFTFLLELSSYYLSILIFSALISPIEIITFKFIKVFH